MKSLREYYNGSAKGERCMKIKKVDLKVLYFKNQDVFSFENYVNRIKESYKTLEELNHPKFETQKSEDPS